MVKLVLMRLGDFPNFSPVALILSSEQEKDFWRVMRTARENTRARTYCGKEHGDHH
jgi:hypothetical protein